MRKDQFINLIESINHVVEARRGYGYGYGRKEHTSHPTAYEGEMMGIPDPEGFDDPAGLASGLWGTQTQVHTPAKQTITPVAPKEMGASGKQLSLASYMPYPGSPRWHPYPYLNDPVIKDNLHGIPQEAHAKLLDMAKNVSVNSPETIRNLGHFLISQGVDPQHPHIQSLFDDADRHEQYNKDKYGRD